MEETGSEQRDWRQMISEERLKAIWGLMAGTCGYLLHWAFLGLEGTPKGTIKGRTLHCSTLRSHMRGRDRSGQVAREDFWEGGGPLVP